MSGNEPRPASGYAITDLATLFPASLGPWRLKTLEEPPYSPVPVPGPALRAVYEQGRQEAEISIDGGAPTGGAKGTRSVYSEKRAQQGDTLVTLALPNGLQFAATSRSADAAALEALLRAIDLDKAEALKPR